LIRKQENLLDKKTWELTDHVCLTKFTKLNFELEITVSA